MPAKYVIVPSPNATLTFTTPAGTGTAKSFECQVTSASITAAQNPVTVPPTGCEGPSTRQGAPTYTLNVNYLQDWGQTDSLSQYLYDHSLEDATFELAVGEAPMPVATGTCQLVEGDYGGDFANPLTATAAMGITGKPAIAAPALATAAAGDE